MTDEEERPEIKLKEKKQISYKSESICTCPVLYCLHFFSSATFPLTQGRNLQCQGNPCLSVLNYSIHISTCL